MFKIGHGYDVHRFSDDRSLILGGVKIPYKYGLLGHSDADVLCHAIMDALLGALALGSIGVFFPDNDEKYKNANSTSLLREIVDIVEKKGYSLANLDCTVIAQEPKLNPYIENIREKLSEILKTNASNVSVKATTEEGLGFTGRLEGISVHAVCLIQKDSKRPIML